jgi:hypothetical protein
MDDFTVSRLEDLPYEMLIEIFQYLFAHELYFSFSNLTIRINSIIKSLSKLMLITISHCDPVFSFFHSLSAIQIDFHHSTSSLLSQFNFSSFVGIRSFSLPPMTCFNSYIEPIEQIDTFICPDLCPQLQSLRIPFCLQRLADWIFSGAFPQLKICHLYRIKYAKIALSFSKTNILQAFRQLTIHRRYARDFQKILLKCPNLTFVEMFHEHLTI